MRRVKYLDYIDCHFKLCMFPPQHTVWLPCVFTGTSTPNMCALHLRNVRIHWARAHTPIGFIASPDYIQDLTGERLKCFENGGSLTYWIYRLWTWGRYHWVGRHWRADASNGRVTKSIRLTCLRLYSSYHPIIRVPSIHQQSLACTLCIDRNFDTPNTASLPWPSPASEYPRSLW